MDAETQVGATLLVSILVSFLIVGIPVMKILNKAGYSRAWILLMFIPLVNIVMLWLFAFANWPRLAPMGYGQAPQYHYAPPTGQPYPQQGNYPQQPPYQPPPR